MQAVRNTADGIETLDVDPAAPEAGDVTVTVDTTGICGSDLHLIDFGPMPVTLGHEVAGRLDDGKAVAVDPIVACGTCDQCRSGARQRCQAVQIVGISRDGGLAERVCVPADNVFALAEGLDPADACLTEPVSVAVHGLGAAGLSGGRQVTVVGGGSIGLTAAAVALDAGAEVSVIARHRPQQEAAERLGARVADPEGATGADLVVEAAGTESALATAVDCAGPGATIVLLGTYWEPVTLPGLAFTGKELRLVGSLGSGEHEGTREIASAAAVLARNPEVADAVISHRFGLGEAAEAFRVAGDRAEGAIKVTLSP